LKLTRGHRRGRGRERRGKQKEEREKREKREKIYAEIAPTGSG
jgi:hypothetical protein